MCAQIRWNLINKYLIDILLSKRYWCWQSSVQRKTNKFFRRIRFDHVHILWNAVLTQAHQRSSRISQCQRISRVKIIKQKKRLLMTDNISVKMNYNWPSIKRVNWYKNSVWYSVNNDVCLLMKWVTELLTRHLLCIDVIMWITQDLTIVQTTYSYLISIKTCKGYFFIFHVNLFKCLRVWFFFQSVFILKAKDQVYIKYISVDLEIFLVCWDLVQSCMWCRKQV